MQYPKHARLCIHIPNGGLRSKREAKTLKSLGVVAGMPDIFIAVPRSETSQTILFTPRGPQSKLIEHHKHGLFIEFKRKIVAGQPKPRVDTVQKEMIELLAQKGYEAIVCYGFDEARVVALEYMRGTR